MCAFIIGGGHLNSIKEYQPSKDLLKDHVILVTGAGQGLGKIAALAYGAHGATVVLHGRKVAKLEKVYDEFLSLSLPEPIIFPLDLIEAKDGDYELMANAIKQQLGRLDGILHNASFFHTLSPLNSQTSDHWQQVLKVNLIAPFSITKACLPLLLKSSHPSVIMTSETHGHNPAAYWGAFAIAKGGLETLTKIWTQELELHPNIRINTLIPGPVASPQRAMTHPGEVKTSLPPMECLVPYYLYLMGNDSTHLRGETIQANPVNLPTEIVSD